MAFFPQAVHRATSKERCQTLERDVPTSMQRLALLALSKTTTTRQTSQAVRAIVGTASPDQFRKNSNSIGHHLFRSEARYLGQWLQPNSSFDNECVRRIQAMKLFGELAPNFWSSRALFKLKQLFPFRCVRCPPSRPLSSRLRARRSTTQPSRPSSPTN